MVSTTIFAALAAPLDPSRVSWRVGSTTGDESEALPSLTSTHGTYTTASISLSAPTSGNAATPMPSKKTVCEIGIKIGDEWVWKANGAGDSDIEAEKGALSDALKRAAVVWGVGRYLYSLEAIWVELDVVEKDGKKFVRGIKKSELSRLAKILEGSPAAKQEMTLAEKMQAAINQANLFVKMKPTEPQAIADFLRDNAARLERCAAYPEAKTILEDAGLLVLAKA